MAAMMGRIIDWVLDSVIRILNGTPIILKIAKWGNGVMEERISLGEPTEEYYKWVKDIKAGEDGDNTYSYSEGIAP